MTTKLEGYQNRQKDTSWGYSIAHVIPFVWIYYAITRRTITPFLFSFLGNFAVGLIFGVIVALLNPNFSSKEVEESGFIIGLVTTPIFTKKGIEKARRYGKDKLRSDT